MKLASLRRVLARIAMIGLPLSLAPATAGCPYCGEDTGVVVRDLVVAPEGEAAFVRLVRRCQVDAEDCVPLCEHMVTARAEYFDTILECTLTQEQLHVEYYDGTVCGRRPAGLARAPRCAGDATAAWLAEAAHLEAASVPAFERLAEDLADHGAPRRLIAAARAAARDEVRHAARIGALAIARGARPAPVVVPRRRARSLAAIARENAVEGCLRETFGAIVAHRQAIAAEDREIRGAMTRIAPDEARHAGLAFAIDAWATPQLSARQRRGIAAARRRAASVLRAAIVAPMPRDARVALGLPTPADATRMLANALLLEGRATMRA